MARPNSTLLVTPGTGATLGTHTPSGLSATLEAWVKSQGLDGSLLTDLPCYVAFRPNSSIDGSNITAGFPTWAFFNATGSGKTLLWLGWWWMWGLNLTVTAGGYGYDITAITTAGAGGTARTLQPLDSGNPAVPGQITFADAGSSTFTTNPTAGAVLFHHETAKGNVGLAETGRFLDGGRNLLGKRQPIICHEGEGVKNTLIAGSDSLNIHEVFLFGII